MGKPMRDENGFTPTQARIMAVLADGSWHRQQELVNAIDEMSDRMSLAVHLYYLRRVLEGRREILVCRKDPEKGSLYRTSRLMARGQYD